MIFNSLEFLAFFPCVTLVYFASPHRVRWVILLAASYWFYGFWTPRYLAFLLISTTVDYLVGLGLGRVENAKHRKALLVASLTVSFGLLFVFKYLRFVASTVAGLLREGGLAVTLDVPDLALPIGISFYTFQTVSYVIDVYRRRREPEHHFGKFALFVAFFPHLVAGPIVRADKLLPQFSVVQRWDAARVLDGLGWMLWGLFKKVVIADRAAALVQAVYQDPQRFQGATVVIATYAFAFQIYCDFSGYSDIAIGAARVLGIELTKNFDDPYGARSLTDFWRRWHISLSTWFRDYVYIPLGGSREGPLRHHRNLLVVFLLSGLWHGANWTFVVWGAIHGAAIVIETVVGETWRRRFADVAWPRPAVLLGGWAQQLLTFHVVCLGWVFFRADDLPHATTVLSQLTYSYPLAIFEEIRRIGPGPVESVELDLAILIVSIAVLEAINVLVLRSPSRRISPTLRFVGFAGLAAWVMLTAVQTRTPFIYFQF